MSQYLGTIGRLLGMLATIPLWLGVAACGDSNDGSASRATPATVTAGSTYKTDRDNDGDNNDDDGKVMAYGHAANAAEWQIAAALAKRYFAAAAAEKGERACRLLAPLFAESAVEMVGHSPAGRDRTCATTMSKLFEVHHQILAEKNASIKVIAVRVKGVRMLAVLEFPPMPEVRQIEERRVGVAWKIFALLDGIIE